MDSIPRKFSGSKDGHKLYHESVSINSDHNVVERFMDPPFLPTKSHPYNSATVSGARLEEDSAEDRELSTAMLKYMGEILMEDELEDKNCMFQDCVALLAAEKSFYDVLGNRSPPQPPPNPPPYHVHLHSPDDASVLGCSSSSGNSNAAANNFVEFEMVELGQLEASRVPTPLVNHILQPNSELYDTVNTWIPFEENDAEADRRCSKHSALYTEEPDEPSDEMFDSALLPRDGEAGKKLHQNEQSKGSNGKAGRVKKKRNKGELATLLSFGQWISKMAHFFANSLEARLAGTGLQMYTALATKRTSVADVIKAYQLYVSACPFKRMSNRYANRVIAKLAEGATRLHIIDFGILYGFQWPCLIQFLSLRPGGPPKLRITGIDFPQSGFRPAERVEETGRRLANYFEDLEIDRDEVLVVNSIYRMKNLLDETVTDKCLKDAVLELIRRINPDIFIHGVLNGNFNTPFFFTRFREALFHFDALFDMLDASVPREDEGRMMFEREIYGKDIMNIIACEGSERIERPDIYKQWQARNERAGLRQLPLEQEILMKVRSIVKMDYHKDFVVEVDGGWMLHGWKGRVIYAISCWKPCHHL
ncbi:Scarecrow-like protein 33 [Vitis vinifera]|uniref:Scarecrow-like protein 33 n=1 Tax=Vitis vinifera TaxID=29760 RepID=A0A438G1E9_VITVI|nr:Scarecrow-like protein 33 [Vitis vinifera]